MITKAEIDGAEFTERRFLRPSRRFRQGYDVDEVDAYLDHVAGGVDEMQRYIAALEEALIKQHGGTQEDVNDFRNLVDGHEVVPRPESTGVTGRAEPERGPGHLDWRERTAVELAPEVLAIENVPEPAPAQDSSTGQSERGLGHQPGWTWIDAAGHVRHEAYPGEHPGPPRQTPAQRRRDKHKQRGTYAPLPGWTSDPADILSPHWKPEGEHFLADWRIEWQDDVAAVDEQIAAWSERAWDWLAADRWDRGARRLGAVA